MNTLSWMLYAAGVLGGLGILFGILTIISTIAVAVVWFLRGLTADYVSKDDMPSDDNPSGSPSYQHWASMVKITNGKWLYITPVIFAILVVAVPSQKTIYMIIASEMGEAVIKSPEAREVFDDLRAVIKKKLADEVES